MKVSCTQENLQKGLQIVGRSVGVRSTLPVLNNILIKTEKGGLSLTATDLELGINTWIGAKVDKEGSITIPAKLLVDYINNNSDKKIDFSQEELNLTLISDHFKTNIKGIDSSEFPLIPQVKHDTEISISSKDLLSSIEKTLIAVALDESRPVLSGVLFLAKENTLTLVATDSYRLAEQKINLDQKINQEISFIIPAKPLTEVARILTETDEKVSIYPGESQVEFVIGKTTIVSRLINGSFPDYEQIIPSSAKTKISVTKQEILSAIKMAQVFARENANNIKFEIEPPKKITVISSSPQLGDNVANISGDVSGDKVKIAFNGKYVLDALNVLKSENIKIDLSGDLAAGQIMGEKDANYLYLIMPLRGEE